MLSSVIVTLQSTRNAIVSQLLSSLIGQCTLSLATFRFVFTSEWITTIKCTQICFWFQLSFRVHQKCILAIEAFVYRYEYSHKRHFNLDLDLFLSKVVYLLIHTLQPALLVHSSISGPSIRFPDPPGTQQVTRSPTVWLWLRSLGCSELNLEKCAAACKLSECQC